MHYYDSSTKTEEEVAIEHSVWDDQAKASKVHAAISATPENEYAKSKYQIDFLKKKITNDAIVLDLGCGYGRIAKYLSKEKAITKYIGVDSSIEMLSLFKERYERNNEPYNLELYYLDITKIPLEDSSVDYVLVSAVFLHNPKNITQKSVDEVFRVLKKGGEIIVFSSFPRLFGNNFINALVSRLYYFFTFKWNKNGPVRYFRRKEIESMFCAFTEVEIVPFGNRLFPKGFVFLPNSICRRYRSLIGDPLSSFFAKYTTVPTHFDVIGKK